MNSLIVSFLLFGAFFGLATYSKRHLFSEGPTRRGRPGSKDALDSRVMWVLTCTTLWPILVLTGMYSLWRVSRAKAHPRRDLRR